LDSVKGAAGLRTDMTDDWCFSRDLPFSFSEASHVLCLAPPTDQFLIELHKLLEEFPGDVVVHIQGDASSPCRPTTSFEDGLTLHPGILPHGFNLCSGKMHELRAMCQGSTWTAKTQGITQIQRDVIDYTRDFIFADVPHPPPPRIDFSLKIRLVCEDLHDMDNLAAMMLFERASKTTAVLALSCPEIRHTEPRTVGAVVNWKRVFEDSDGDFHFPFTTEPHGDVNMNLTLAYHNKWRSTLRSLLSKFDILEVAETSVARGQPLDQSLFKYHGESKRHMDAAVAEVSQFEAEISAVEVSEAKKLLPENKAENKGKKRALSFLDL